MKFDNCWIKYDFGLTADGAYMKKHIFTKMKITKLLFFSSLWNMAFSKFGFLDNFDQPFLFFFA